MAPPEPGASAEAVRVFSQEDFDRFAELTGDHNPIHVDSAYSATSLFGRTAAHGMFLYSCLCALMVDAFPGAVQESQDLMFPAPTFAGEPITLRAEVTTVEGTRVVVSTTITREDGTATCIGEAVLRTGER